MILISQSQFLTENARIPNPAIYLNLLDSKLICIDPLVMIMHKVTKTLSPFITEYSKGDQLLGNILLALSFLILNRLKILTLKHFQIPF